MSDLEIGVKFVEEWHLELFLEAYRASFGTRLELAAPGERPDFICRTSSGRTVGVELTRVMRDPHMATHERIMCGQEFADPQDTLDRIFWTIEKKQAKRQSAGWSHANNTILMIGLTDC